MESHIVEILTFLIGVGVIGLFRLATRVTSIHTALVGVKGDNGLVGNVQQLTTTVGDLTQRVVGVEHDVKSLVGGRREQDV